MSGIKKWTGDQIHEKSVLDLTRSFESYMSKSKANKGDYILIPLTIPLLRSTLLYHKLSHYDIVKLEGTSIGSKFKIVQANTYYSNTSRLHHRLHIDSYAATKPINDIITDLNNLPESCFLDIKIGPTTRLHDFTKYVKVDGTKRFSIATLLRALDYHKISKLAIDISESNKAVVLEQLIKILKTNLAITELK